VTVSSSGLAIELPEQQRHVVDLQERTWLPRHCRGDAAAFPALLAAYRRPVYAYLVRSGVAAPDRDDLFQSVFLKVHAAAGSYEPAYPLGPWIFTIVANTVRNHARARRKLHLVSAEEDPPDPPDPNPGPERIAQARETVAWLEEAISALPAAQREVLLLATVAGLAQQEVAAALDLPLNTVKTRLRRARLALAKALAQRDAPAGRAGEAPGKAPGEFDEDL
jgi:RNA polymerase sigma-70 factor (ECF subfamily)